MPPNTSNQRHLVTAVIVSHDGARLLPGLVQAMRDQTHPVDRAIGVDTSSRDRSGALLAELLGASGVFGMEAGTGYGAAVARALKLLARGESSRATGQVEWIWLLHDDCEPAPDALEQMLRVASRSEATAILGPKLRDLADRRVLRETGLTVDRAGRRLTGIEPGEIDQGQHDGNRSVLAVSTAGMLIRRDAWERLGGFDPMLPLFRDDIDLCWRGHAAGYEVRVVTDAVVYHREFSARQIRKVPAAGGQPRRLDRRAALFVLAANMPFLPMLVTLAGCVTGSLLRAIWFLLTKQRRRAFDQLSAAAWLAGHPVKLWRARRQRAPGRKRAYAVLKPQIPGGKTMMRLAEGLVGMLSRSSRYEWTGEHGGGVTEDPDDELPLPPPDSMLRRVLTHPGVLLLIGLLLITCVAERSLLGSVLSGSGTLAGGALAPAWGGASDLWHEYLAGFHAVGVGSTASAPPYLAVLAALATLFGGKAWLAVDVLLLGCVPIAGMAAYLAARRVTKALGVRVWLAVGYAMLPVAVGAVAAGRLGSAVVFMLLPLIAVTLGRMIAPSGGSAAAFTGPRARRAAWAAGLLIAIAAAFAPLIWMMALAAMLATLVLAAIWYQRAHPASLRRWPGTAVTINVVIVAAVPALVLLPWTVQLFAHPSSMLLEAGLLRPGIVATRLRPAPLLLLSPGGPGLPPVWVTAGLAAAAFCALLLRRRPALVRSGWAVALGGLIAAATVSRFEVTSPVSGTPVPAWPGVALAVAAAGLLLAATPVLEWAVGVAWGVAASEASLATRARLVGRRGAAALLLGALAVATPVAAAGSWLLHGVRGPVGVARAQVLPPFVADAAGQNRTLVLRRPQGVLTYQLLRGRDPVLGEAELPEDAAASSALDTVVAALAAPASGDAGDAGQALSSFGIGWVLLPAPVDPALAAQLNSQAGLQVLASSPAYVVWRVADPVAGLRVVAPDGAVTALPGGSVSVPASAVGTLLLAEPAGDWSASLGGRALTALPRPVDGWAQGFTLPPGGGPLLITRDNLARQIMLGIEAVAVMAAFVLALPGSRGTAEPEAADAAGTAGAMDRTSPAEETMVLVPVGIAAGPGQAPAAPAPAQAPAQATTQATTQAVSSAHALTPAEPWRGPADPWEVPPDPWEPQPTAAAPAPTPRPAASPAPGSAPAPGPGPAAAPPQRKGGSHRAARHGKPARGFGLRRKGGPR